MMSKQPTMDCVHIESGSEAQTMAVAASLAASLSNGSVIALEGPLGAGKTCFVRGLAEGLSLNPKVVSSPTFVLCQEYINESGGSNARSLVHIDAYRMNGSEDLESVGLTEILDRRDAVIAIEWADRITNALPPEHLTIRLSHGSDSNRNIEITGPASLVMKISDASRMSAQCKSSSCRTCGKSVAVSSERYPFCSDRCRMADMGRWFMGEHRISRPIHTDDPESFDGP